MIRKICEWVCQYLPSITIPDTQGNPYLTRYFLFGAENPYFNIFLHKFHASDKDRADNGTLLLHNHPWKWSVAFILAGGYSEERRQPDDTVMIRDVAPGTLNYLNDLHFHRVDLYESDGWSIFITSHRRNKETRWGFWDRQARLYTDGEEQLHKLGKKVILL
jgi:hypothetical protein